MSKKVKVIEESTKIPDFSSLERVYHDVTLFGFLDSQIFGSQIDVSYPQYRLINVDSGYVSCLTSSDLEVLLSRHSASETTDFSFLYVCRAFGQKFKLLKILNHA